MAPTGERPPRVLYVDDNASNVKLLRAVMSFRPEIELLTAGAGYEGLEAARREIPDLVLLDLNLPDIRGDEVLDRLRADPLTAGIPTIMVTAEDDAEVARRLIERGAAGYIAKPFDMDLLLKTVDDLIGGAD